MCRRRREEERGGARSEEEVGRSVGRSVVGRSSVGRSAAGAAPKVRTPHNDVGKNCGPYVRVSLDGLDGLGFKVRVKG